MTFSNNSEKENADSEECETMLKRTITAIVALLLFVPVLIFSGTAAGKYVFISVIGALALVAVYEMCGCFGLKKRTSIALPSYLYAIAVTLITVFFGDSEKYISFVLVASFIFMFIAFAAAMFHIGNVRVSQAAGLISTSLYIICGFFSVIYLRYADMGAYLYWLIFIGAWATDTGAYFVGVLIGKHKLIPQVSPKKTVEGAIGGVLGCVVGYIVFGACVSHFASLEVNFTALALSAVCISVISQLGDLIASYIKREHDIKDYGNLFPGHGGVMDRFDSIIAVAPVIMGIAVIFGIKLIY